MVATIYYWPQRSCGQGNIFTPVCHSVHRGVLPQCMLGYHHPPRTRQPPPRTRQIHPPDQEDTPTYQTDTPWTRQTPPSPDQADTPHTRQTPQDQADTPQTRQTPLGTRQTPLPRPSRHTPRTRQTPPSPRPGRHPPGDQADTPQTRQTNPLPGRPPRKKTLAYGLWAAGTHPTGMHSCLKCIQWKFLDHTVIDARREMANMISL